MEDLKGFEKIVDRFPKTWKVLDVGAGGLDGVNTSNFLVDKFAKNYTGITIDAEKAELYKKVKEPAHMIIGSFYSYPFDKKFDLIVLDLGIVDNVRKDWEGYGIYPLAYDLLKKDGVVICYVMATDEYGDKLDGIMLRRHHREFWRAKNPGVVDIVKKLARGYVSEYDVIAVEQEAARPYIYWVALKKI